MEKYPKALTYNVHGFLGRDRRFDPQRVLSVLKHVDAEIIAVQEVGPRMPHPFDGYEFLVNELPHEAVAGPTRYVPGGRYGNLLLSKWPIISKELIDLSVTTREPRGAIIADLQTPFGAVLRVVAVHLGLRSSERHNQLMVLSHHIRAGPPGPLLFLGDLNFWRRAHRLPVLDEVDVRSIRYPRTFPSHMPVWSLDQIRARPTRLVRHLRVVNTASAKVASDHLPLMGEIESALLQGRPAETPEAVADAL